MAINKVQFQKGLSLNEFIENYGTEEQCFKVLYKLRWPEGFICPKCGYNKCCQLTQRSLQQCHKCHHQTSITAGTIFESTKLPLTTWFQAFYLISQDKKGISAIELHRHLGISYQSAWRMKQKIMQVMKEREEAKLLSGFIEVDDAYLGGERTGCKRGRGADDKTPFIAAVETTSEGQPVRIKLSILKGFFKEEITVWSRKNVVSGSTVISDGLACFNGVVDAGCKHDKIICGGGRASVEEPEFYWVNTILGNLKSALRSTYHAIRPKYAQRYLAEFQYRFNRRFNLKDFIPRLAYVALRTPALPGKLLRIA
ncbi:IS1595 family transposase [Zooshikella harenae]|uniref:IS1595 family transposase n=1 Tax=Zooshikella harenae TaxID=2827238 RepID=A0ABS5ZLT3_9GAMM|nr:IS1595 family transposase [Zooshikella harenae]MBU2714435.1 IS1595 family transposase [Zooshikella harenae]